MSLAERQSRWQAAWDAIKDASALGWGRTFVAALLRATARRPLHLHGAEPPTHRRRARRHAASRAARCGWLSTQGDAQSLRQLIRSG